MAATREVMVPTHLCMLMMFCCFVKLLFAIFIAFIIFCNLC